jgi:citronellol/citronellal dehydrogenase
MTTTLAGKTVFITGSSRGIGLAMGLKVARHKANVVITGKTEKEHPNLPGTIYTAAAEIEKAGGQALAIKTDVRSEEEVKNAVEKTIETFGGIDICINNASALFLMPTLGTPMKRFDLINQVNTRATFMCSQYCLPWLKKSNNPHILNLSPPLNLDPKWFASNLAYTISKYGMSMCVLGMAAEFRQDGIAVNALWPKTTIATAAVKNIVGGEKMIKMSRSPEIMADAAYQILIKDSRKFTGNFCIDEEILRKAGIEDFESYAIDKTQPLQADFFL